MENLYYSVIWVLVVSSSPFAISPREGVHPHAQSYRHLSAEMLQGQMAAAVRQQGKRHTEVPSHGTRTCALLLTGLISTNKGPTPPPHRSLCFTLWTYSFVIADVLYLWWICIEAWLCLLHSQNLLHWKGLKSCSGLQPSNELHQSVSITLWNQKHGSQHAGPALVCLYAHERGTDLSILLTGKLSQKTSAASSCCHGSW